MISADLTHDLEKYRVEKAIPFLLLSDPECEVIKEYGIYNPSERNGVAIPSVFILDRSGVVRYSKIQSKIFRTRSQKFLKEAQKL